MIDDIIIAKSKIFKCLSNSYHTYFKFLMHIHFKLLYLHIWSFIRLIKFFKSIHVYLNIFLSSKLLCIILVPTNNLSYISKSITITSLLLKTSLFSLFNYYKSITNASWFSRRPVKGKKSESIRLIDTIGLVGCYIS